MNHETYWTETGINIRSTRPRRRATFPIVQTPALGTNGEFGDFLGFVEMPRLGSAAFGRPTASGWTETGATLENVALIKSVVGDHAQVKASGGVHDLETLLAMVRLDVTRFGVNMAAGVKILEDCAAAPGAAVEV